MECSFSNIIGGALLGSFISLCFYPVANYLLIRSINRCGTKFIVNKNLKNDSISYVTLPLSIHNKSCSTLKNVTPYVLIKYSEGDIIHHPGIGVFTVGVDDRPLMLSWAEMTDIGNKPHMDINQAMMGGLNLIRLHKNNSDATFIEFASEQGFSDRKEKKCRILLNGEKDYEFEILLTADNMFPKKKKYRFDHINDRIIEAG